MSLGFPLAQPEAEDTGCEGISSYQCHGQSLLNNKQFLELGDAWTNHGSVTCSAFMRLRAYAEAPCQPKASSEPSQHLSKPQRSTSIRHDILRSIRSKHSEILMLQCCWTSIQQARSTCHGNRSLRPKPLISIISVFGESDLHGDSIEAQDRQ